MSTPVKEKPHPILSKALSLEPAIVEARRALHEHPELSFQESKTMAFVAERLQKLGLTVKQGVGKTGLTAEIGSGGRLIGLRADMDALPITEANNQQYKSKNAGVMHACGHDAHTACLLGAAEILVEEFRTGKIEGRVRFIFQPAEEKVNQEGKSGAVLMIEDGAIEGLEAMVALHVYPALPVGGFGISDGPILAACDSFDVTIEGRGCHGAEPERGLDPIAISGQVIQALHQIVSRRTAAVEPAVITIGGIRSSTYAPNVIPQSVELTGTVRYFNPALHELLEAEIKRAVSIAEALGGTYKLAYRHENPALINHKSVTEAVKQTVVEYFGEQSVYESPPHMGAEDFAFFTEQLPCCYLILGVMLEGDPREFHTSTFDLNEKALPLGSAVLAGSALKLLKS